MDNISTTGICAGLGAMNLAKKLRRVNEMGFMKDMSKSLRTHGSRIGKEVSTSFKKNYPKESKMIKKEWEDTKRTVRDMAKPAEEKNPRGMNIDVGKTMQYLKNKEKRKNRGIFGIKY